MNIGKTFILFTLSGMLVACGGGGGSASNSATNTSTYGGSRTTTQITAENVDEFTNSIFQTVNTTSNGGDYAQLRPVGTTAGELSQTNRYITNLAINIAKNTRNTYQSRAVNESEACTNNGNITTSGNINDATNTGNVRIAFNQCSVEDVLFNGSIDVNISGYNSTYNEPTTARLTYNNLNINAEGETFTILGSINLTSDPAARTTNSTTQLNLKSNLEGQETLVNMNISFAENADLSLTTHINGEACENNEGCVNINTTTPLKFDYIGNPMEGELLLGGLNNSKAKITIISYNLLQVNVDEDGDGVYEHQHTLE